jgi:hypothetical protein
MSDSSLAAGGGPVWPADGGVWGLWSLEASLARCTDGLEPAKLDVAAEGMQHILDLELRRGETMLPAWAAFELGRVRAKQNQRGPAVAAWRQAMDTGDPEYGPRAACCLAVICQQEHDWGQAREAWQFALDAGNDRCRSAALLGLGAVAEQQGEV